MRRLAVGLAIVALLVVAGTAAAASAGGEPTIQPDRFEEFNVRMDAGWSLDYNWSSEAPVYFDIHSHQGAEVTYHVENASSNGTAGSFEAPTRQVYSLLWENRGDAAVTVTWRADGQWIGRDEHFEDEQTTPGPGVALVAATLLAAAAWRRHRSW